MQTEEFQLFDDLFDNFELELLDVISQMTEEEREVLAQSEGLPQCISEILEGENSEEAALEPQRNDDSSIAA